MTRAAILALAVVSLFALFAADVAEAQRERTSTMILTVGQQRTISARNVRNYSPGATGIIDIRVLPDGSEFVIVALSAGQTSLLLIYENGDQLRYDITVTAPTGEVTPSDSPVSRRVNVRLDLYFVEFNERSQLHLGIAFPDSIGTGAQVNGVFDFALATPDFTSAVLQFSQVLPRIDLMHSNGNGRVRRHAVLVTANGTEAQFDSGGDVNVLVPGALGQTDLRTVHFGSRLTVTPRFDPSSQRIEVVISAEMSELFDSGQGVPGTTVTSARSTANLGLGQALAIAGLSAVSERQTRRGLPGLSQIPILGIFFGSHGWESEETENVLIIVPTVVEPVDPSRQDLVQEALRLFEDHDGDPNESNLIQLGTTPPSAVPGQ